MTALLPGLSWSPCAALRSAARPAPATHSSGSTDFGIREQHAARGARSSHRWHGSSGEISGQAGRRLGRGLRLRCSSQGSSSNGGPGANGAEPPRLRLRRARADDAEQLASLCAEAFPFVGIHQQLAWGLLRALFPPRSEAEWQRQFERALESKAAAVAAYQQMKAEGELIWRPAVLLEPQVTAERQLQQRNYVRRGFHCLVAEEVESGALLGTMALSLARPQAALPPPFPTSAPLSLYVSNVAVREDRRRQGVATALLGASERLAARWGHGSIWLHVEADNLAAVELYRGCGYTAVRRDPEWIPGSAYLMTKQIPPSLQGLQQQCSGGGAVVLSAAAAAMPRSRGRSPGVRAGGEVRGSTRGEDGVFVWEVGGQQENEQ